MYSWEYYHPVLSSVLLIGGGIILGIIGSICAWPPATQELRTVIARVRNKFNEIKSSN